MGRAKRFYLCNLIPLWEIDDDSLEVDWGVEEARDGDLVEMRVVVKKLSLQTGTPPNFSIQYEINESDFLLSGGLDDHVVTITSRQTAEEGCEHRPIFPLKEGERPPAAEQLANIFVTPAKTKEGEAASLIQCYWKAQYKDDVSGAPEYYFDAKLDVGGEEHEERSDRELTVHEAQACWGKGIGLPGADLKRAQELHNPPEPVVIAAGWTKGEAKPGDEVEMLAVIRGGMVGQLVSFEIASDPETGGILLERFDLPLGIQSAMKVAWRVPEFIPMPGIRSLGFNVRISETAFAARDMAEAPASPGVPLFGALSLKTNIDLQLVDSLGEPLRGAKYRVLLANSEVLAGGEGTTDGNGMVHIANVPSAPYILEVDGITVVDAEEHECKLPPFRTANTVFTFTDVRLPQ